MITEHEAAIEEYLRIQKKKRLYNFLPIKEPQKDDGGQASSKLANMQHLLPIKSGLKFYFMGVYN